MSQKVAYKVKIWNSSILGMDDIVVCHVSPCGLERNIDDKVEFDCDYFADIEEYYNVIWHVILVFHGLTRGRWSIPPCRISGDNMKTFHEIDTEEARIIAEDMLTEFIKVKMDEAFVALDRYFYEGSNNCRFMDNLCIEIVHMIADGYIDNAYLDESRIENLLRIVNTNGMPHEAAILLNLGKGEKNVSEFLL